MTRPYDVAVLGAGSAGYACALRAADLGLNVALIDEGPLGGTCLHRGCIPTKAWLHAAKVRRTVASADRFGITAALWSTDATAIRRYVQGVVDSLYRGLAALVSGRGIDVIRSRGTLETRETLGIRTAHGIHPAHSIVVATGAQPLAAGVRVDGERILTSDHALRLDTLPGKAIILGGGVIGVEFASMWTDLGVSVTLVEATSQLLPGMEPAHVRVLAKALASRGVDIRLGTPAEGAVVTGEGVQVDVAGEPIQADVLLVAVGRRPSTAGLGLEEAGVALTDSGHVRTDEALRTSLDGVYAAGDVVLGPQLAHRGYAHGLFLAETIARLRGFSAPEPNLPRDSDLARIVYSGPQIASVGLNTSLAGPDAEVIDHHLGGNGWALVHRPPGERETGLVRLVRRRSGEILGVHAVGEDIAELMGEATLLVNWLAQPEDFGGIIHPHPTLSESLGEASWALAGRPLHTHAG